MAKICEYINLETKTMCPFGCSPTWRMCHRDDCMPVPGNDCCPRGWHITETEYLQKRKAIGKTCREHLANIGTKEKKTNEDAKKMIPLYRLLLGIEADTELDEAKVKEAYKMACFRNTDTKELEVAFNILMEVAIIDAD